MRFVIVVVLALIGSAIAAVPASAHRPYFTQVEKIRLPNSELGEVRLLNGDGIFGPDPVRAIIVDAGGRLLARSPQSISMALACQEDGTCLIYDFSEGKMLDPVPTSFRQGPIVPGLSDGDRNGLWEIEDGAESWGFTYRDLSSRERARGYGLMVKIGWPLLIFDVVIGVLCGLLALGIILIIRNVGARYFERFMAAFAALLIIGMGLFLVLVSGFVSLIGGLTSGPWLASLGFGGVSVLACALIRRKSRVGTAPQ